MNQETITDAERYPTLSEHGRAMLRFLREHPHAPLFHNESGNRLGAEDIEMVREWEREALSAELGDHWQRPPDWLDPFVERCFTTVPFYRRYGTRPKNLQDIPTVSRAELSRDIARFVPDDTPIDRLINYRTSGTTGHPLLLPSHPIVAAQYLAFHKRALRRFGIELRHGRGQVGVVLVGWQRKCFTYVSVTPTMDESGLAKINLHPDDWRQPDDRARYLDALAPEVYTGDPISLAELMSLPLRTRPRAVLSTSMTLLPAMRRRMEEHFRCPVLDLYSMNEAGPVGVADESAGGHVLLQHRLLIEILDPHALPVTPGERGEITLTGGFNFCLPLLRYRTGDFASLRKQGNEPVLVGLEGRPPVRFRSMTGEWLNNIEVTHCLHEFAIPQFTLRQLAGGSLHLRMTGNNSQDPILKKLSVLFGPGQRITCEQVPAFEGKVVQYETDLSPEPS